jgi:heme o synthase
MKKKYLIILLKSGRWRLSIATALASAAGALTARPSTDFRLAAISIGSVFYALAVTWLNQIQERQSDSLMSRTKSRPLASNTLPVGYAIVWTILCMAASSLLLFLCGGLSAVIILGVVTLFYNGIYTPMKRRSLFALIPGAFAGAAPPVLGWVCAGGNITDSTPLVLFILFFLWQVPHFWFTAARNSVDYDAIRLPLPWRAYGDRLYSQILILWVMAFCIAILALPAFGLVHSAIAHLFVLFISVPSMTGLAFHVLKRPSIEQKITGDQKVEDLRLYHLSNQPFCHSTIQPMSISINFSLAAVCVVLVAEKLIGG